MALKLPSDEEVCMSDAFNSGMTIEEGSSRSPGMTQKRVETNGVGEAFDCDEIDVGFGEAENAHWTQSCLGGLSSREFVRRVLFDLHNPNVSHQSRQNLEAELLRRCEGHRELEIFRRLTKFFLQKKVRLNGGWKRDAGNYAKAIGVSTEDLMSAVRPLLVELLEENFD